MRGKTAGRLAWSMLGAAVVLWLVGLWLASISGPPAPNAPKAVAPISVTAQAGFQAIYLLFSVLGLLIVSRRPENNLGWLFCGAGLLAVVGGLPSIYSYHALMSDPGSLPFGAFASVLADTFWLPGIGFIVFVFLLFPGGHTHSRGERLILWAAIVALILGPAAQLLEEHSYGLPSVKNPLGHLLPKIVSAVLSPFAFMLLVVSLLASVFFLIRRYRRSEGEERLQMKWFAYAALLAAISTVVSNFHDDPPLYLIAVEIVATVALPVSIAVAILKYRLYEIDVIINKTVVFGALAAFITAVYVAIVVGIGTLFGRGDEPSVALSILATAVVAIAFQPVRSRVQRFANRLVYGKRAEPYEVLSQFSERVAGTEATEQVLPRTARVLAEGTGATQADVWLRVGTRLVREASWPDGDGTRRERVTLPGDDLPELPDATRAVPVRHRGELLGALALAKAPGDPLKPAEEKLLEDLASQAGLMLRNVGLTADLEAQLEEISRQARELRSSRQRIIEAQDAERRKLEKNIHDGAQQHLVALAVKLKLAKSLTEKDAAKARAMLQELQGETTDALDTLRDLARGIYPPLLEEQGVAAAIEAQAKKGTLPVKVEAGDFGRATLEAEGTVYFCCLEALQNAAKYANASRVKVRLARGDGDLTFSVEDDGDGFDPATQPLGSGLQNMKDRVDALGGSVEVSSTPGRGTTVSGRVPARELEPMR